MAHLEKQEAKLTSQSLLVFLVWTLGVILWSGCQARKEGQIDTTVPESKGSYDPQKGSGPAEKGEGKNPAPGTLPKEPSNLGAGPDKTEAAKLLDGWAGTTDQPNGWKLTDLEPSQSPPPSTGGTAIPPATTNPPAGSGAPTGSTAATASVTYAVQIKPLLERYCVTCHKAGGTRSSSPLDVYPTPTLAQDSVQRIVAGSMPKAGSPQLTPQEKDLFKQWQAGQFAQ